MPLLAAILVSTFFLLNLFSVLAFIIIDGELMGIFRYYVLAYHYITYPFKENWYAEKGKDLFDARPVDYAGPNSTQFWMEHKYTGDRHRVSDISDKGVLKEVVIWAWNTEKSHQAELIEDAKRVRRLASINERYGDSFKIKDKD